jgi:hypothetical protein
MKLPLEGYIPNNIEYNFIMMSMFYITEKGKKVNTHVDEVHVKTRKKLNMPRNCCPNAGIRKPLLRNSKNTLLAC